MIFHSSFWRPNFADLKTIAASYRRFVISERFVIVFVIELPECELSLPSRGPKTRAQGDVRGFGAAGKGTRGEGVLGLERKFQKGNALVAEIGNCISSEHGNSIRAANGEGGSWASSPKEFL